MTSPEEDRKVRLIFSPTLVRLATISELVYEDLAQLVTPENFDPQTLPESQRSRFTVHLVESGFKYSAQLSWEVATEVFFFLKSPALREESEIIISRPTPTHAHDKQVPIWRQYKDYTDLKVVHNAQHNLAARGPGRVVLTCELCVASHRPNHTKSALDMASRKWPQQDHWRDGPSDEELYQHMRNEAGDRWITIIDQYDDERVFLAGAWTTAFNPCKSPAGDILCRISVLKVAFTHVTTYTWRNLNSIARWILSDCPAEYVEDIRVTVLKKGAIQSKEEISSLEIFEDFESHIRQRNAHIDDDKVGVEGSSEENAKTKATDEIRESRDLASDGNLPQTPVGLDYIKAQFAKLDTQAQTLAPMTTSDEIKQLFDGLWKPMRPLEKGKGGFVPPDESQRSFDDAVGERQTHDRSGDDVEVAKPEERQKVWSAPTLGNNQPGASQSGPISSASNPAILIPSSDTGDDTATKAQVAAFNSHIICGDISDECDEAIEELEEEDLEEQVYEVLEDEREASEEESDDSEGELHSSELPPSLSPSVVALSRLETPTYINELLDKPDHTTASTRLLRIMRDEKVKLDSSLGLKLLDLVEALKRGGELSPIDIAADSARASDVQAASELKSLHINSFNKTSERLNEFAGMLNAIAEAVGVNLQDGDEQEAKAQVDQGTIKAQDGSEKTLTSPTEDNPVPKDQSWEELRYRHIAHTGQAVPVAPPLGSTPPPAVESRVETGYSNSAGPLAGWPRSGLIQTAAQSIVPTRNPFVNYGTLPKPFAATGAGPTPVEVGPSASVNARTGGGPTQRTKEAQYHPAVGVSTLKMLDTETPKPQQFFSGFCGTRVDTNADGADQPSVPAETTETLRSRPRFYAAAPEPELPEYAPMVPEKNEPISAAPSEPVPPVPATTVPLPIRTTAPPAAQTNATSTANPISLNPAAIRTRQGHTQGARLPYALRGPYSCVPASRPNNGQDLLSGLTEERSPYPWRCPYVRYLSDYNVPPTTAPPNGIPVAPALASVPTFAPFGSVTTPLGPNFGHASAPEWCFAGNQLHRPPFEPSFPPSSMAPAGVGPAPSPGFMGPNGPLVMPFPYSWYGIPPTW